MNPKRNSLWFGREGVNAMFKFTGGPSFGLVLFAFGLPMSGEWLAAAMPRVAGKYPPGISLSRPAS